MLATSTDEPVVGVLGGMGPEATVELMARVVRRTPARDDIDHIRMLVDNNPKVPSRIAFLLEGGKVDPAPTLAGMARGLQSLGATHLVMPCNTAHAFVDSIRAAVDIPFIDMLDQTIGRLSGEARGEARIGVLGSPALRRIGNVDRRCVGRPLHPVYADEAREGLALSVIRRVKAGDSGSAVQNDYAALKRHLVGRGATALMVCCTEYSVLEGAAAPPPVPIVDTLDVLVEAILALRPAA